jgi:hypothetical protein
MRTVRAQIVSTWPAGMPDPRPRGRTADTPERRPRRPYPPVILSTVWSAQVRPRCSPSRAVHRHRLLSARLAVNLAVSLGLASGRPAVPQPLRPYDRMASSGWQLQGRRLATHPPSRSVTGRTLLVDVAVSEATAPLRTVAYCRGGPAGLHRLCARARIAKRLRRGLRAASTTAWSAGRGRLLVDPPAFGLPHRAGVRFPEGPLPLVCKEVARA